MSDSAAGCSQCNQIEDAWLGLILLLLLCLLLVAVAFLFRARVIALYARLDGQDGRVLNMSQRLTIAFVTMRE